MFDVNTPVVDEEYGDLDEERPGEYIDALMTEFADSPEGSEFCEQYDGALGYAALFMEYLAQYEGLSVAEARARDTREVVFQLFPRKVSVDADEAEAIIDELRAFWQFLKRTRELPQADEILELLGEGAVERLEDKLADEGSFGMAKSFFMAGKSAGFDMSTQEGLNQFMAVYHAGLLQAQDEVEDLEDEPVDHYAPRRLDPIRSETPKVGRNEPCPCGSGRKYKKCCGGR
jgi:hypothetical protein